MGVVRQAGTSTRTASGNATKVWASATNHHFARQSNQPMSKVSMRPSPSVTGDTASTTIDSKSTRRPIVLSRTIANVVSTASATPNTPANNAVRIEARIDAARDVSKIVRHAASDNVSPTCTDLHSNAPIGSSTNVAVTPATPNAKSRWRWATAVGGNAARRESPCSCPLSRRTTPITPTTMTSCTRASTVAAGMSPMPNARSAMSLSNVLRRGPPSTRTTANEEKQYKKITAAAAAVAPRMSGQTMVRQTTVGEAPSVRAALMSWISSNSRRAPTTRTTTAMLKYTWAITTANMV